MRRCYRKITYDDWRAKVICAMRADKSVNEITFDCCGQPLMPGDQVMIIVDPKKMAPYSLIGSTGIVENKWSNGTFAKIIFNNKIREEWVGYYLLKIEPEIS
jgi:hypothetical protein